jgi:hypothetical protein
MEALNIFGSDINLADTKDILATGKYTQALENMGLRFHSSFPETKKYAIENKPYALECLHLGLNKTNNSSTIIFHSNANFAQQLVYCKKIPCTTMCTAFTVPTKTFHPEWHAHTTTQIPLIVGLGQASIYEGPSQYLPNQIKRIFAPGTYGLNLALRTIPYTAENLDQLIESSINTLPKSIGQDKGTKVAQEYMALFEGIPQHISNSYNSPIFIADEDNFYKYFPKPTYPTYDNFPAIEIMRNKGTLAKVSIPTSKYLANPDKYIVCLNLPKVVTIYEPCSNGVIAGRLVAELPTLIIPLSFLNPKSKSFTLAEQFFTALKTETLEKFVDPVAYAKRVERLGILSKYWDGPLQVIGDADVTTASLISSTPVEKDLGPAISAFTSIPAYKILKNYQDTLKELEHNRNKLRLFQNEVSSLLSQNKTRLQEAEKVIKETTPLVGKQTLKLEDVNKKLNETDQVLASTRAQTITQQTQYVKEVESINVDLTARSSLLLTGLRTTYRMIDFNANFPGNDDQDKLSNLLSSLVNGDEIIALHFATNRPSKIYVDSAEKPLDECSVVLGGPYKITISYNTVKNDIAGHIFLVDASSIFGMKSLSATAVEVKQHPHSAPMKIRRGDLPNFANFITSPTKMCFGELEAGLVEDFKTKNINNIKIAAYRWLTSAWSKDQWGSQWQWFPAASQTK